MAVPVTTVTTILVLIEALGSLGNSRGEQTDAVRGVGGCPVGDLHLKQPRSLSPLWHNRGFQTDVGPTQLGFGVGLARRRPTVTAETRHNSFWEAGLV